MILVDKMKIIKIKSPLGKTLWGFFLTLALASCNSGDKEEKADSNTEQTHFYESRGYAQGTTYSIVYRSEEGVDVAPAVDSILKAFDMELSTYEPASKISEFNAHGKAKIDSNFIMVWEHSLELYQKTKGYFNPCLAPLFELWGKDYNKAPLIGQYEIDSVLKITKPELIELKGDSLFSKDYAQVQFNAIAQGYSVDLISKYLESIGIHHYKVEIGGELLCKGDFLDQKGFNIIIDKPVAGNTHISFDTVKVNNYAMATSGNYRHFTEIGGKKYGHILNPFTGYPDSTDILSITVMAPTCTEADAWSTALFVMGKERAINLVEEFPELKIYIIYHQNNKIKVWKSNGFPTI